MKVYRDSLLNMKQSWWSLLLGRGTTQGILPNIKCWMIMSMNCSSPPGLSTTDRCSVIYDWVLERWASVPVDPYPWDNYSILATCGKGTGHHHFLWDTVGTIFFATNIEKKPFTKSKFHLFCRNHVFFLSPGELTHCSKQVVHTLGCVVYVSIIICWHGE